ncbi:MAG: FAD-dependent oxidoreductase [Rhodospirillales bacterium]|nr:FAD-dependent oxidoreductase [Rhodospirillales bacterium]
MRETNVIVGAGQAGGWAAVTMRQAGFGGRIVLIGAEAHRPYERPPLSKSVLTAAVEPAVSWFHDPSRYLDLQIDLLLGTAAASIDVAARRVVLRDGREIAWDRLLLATGGRARPLAVPGGERALLLRTLEDARAIRARLDGARRVVCIGAGVIGLEIAASARARGAAVTVLEAADRPMGRSVSAEGAAFVAGLHRANGVDLRCGVAVAAIERQGDGSEVVACADGAAFPADLVVAGVGMERNLALAEAAGIATDRGVLVDEHTRTSAEGVFAAGDVAAFPHPLFGPRLRLESWRHAQNHGIAAGQAMAGAGKPYDDIPWFWTDQFGVNLQVAGLPALAARTVVRVDAPPAFVAVHLTADDRVVGVTAAGAPRDIRAGTALIRAGRTADAAQLADPAVPLQKLGQSGPGGSGPA